MNENDILRAMNGIDESYLTEKPRIRPRKHFRRPAAVIVAACAVLAMSVTAAAVIHSFYHEETVERYGLADIPMTEETLPENVGSMDNGHIRVTVDKIVSDGTMGFMAITVDMLDEKGYGLGGSSKVVAEAGHAEMPHFVVTAEKSNGKEYDGEKNLLYACGFGPAEDVGCMRIEAYYDARKAESCDTLYLSIVDGNSRIKDKEVIKGLANLRLDNFRKNLPTRELRDSAGRVMTVSPVSISFPDSRDGLWCYKNENAEIDASQKSGKDQVTEPLVVTYNDGTVYDAEESWMASYQDGTNCFHRFDKPIDFENVKSVALYDSVFSLKTE